MENRVFWNTSDGSDTWHLYPDCNALQGANGIRIGPSEAAINAGKSHVCPLCRVRFAKVHPLSDSAEGGTPDCSRGKDLLLAPVPTPPPETPPASDVPHAAAPSKPKSHIRTAVVLLAALFFLFIFLYPLYESEIEAAYNRGYDAGYTVGEADGEETGLEEGYRTGYNDGYIDGYRGDRTNKIPSSNQTPPTSTTFKVTASVDCIYNNSVGNDWSYYYEVDGKNLPTTITVKAGDIIPLYVEITENDSVPDVGWWDGTTTVESDFLKYGFHTTVEVPVIEGSGRYSGNEAKFEVTFDFVPQ